MKILLPLAALGILSTLFLLSKNVDPNSALPLAKINVQQRAKDQGATNADFAGVTSSGDEITMLTDKTKPKAGEPHIFVSDDVRAEYVLTSGTLVDVLSNHGTVNQSKSSAVLEGDVYFVTTTGYIMKTEVLKTRFDELYAESEDEVTGRGPVGDLTAGRMLLNHHEDTETAHLLFTDGVKVIYRPQNDEE